MNNWPSVIKLKVVKKDDGRPLERRILVHMQVVSPRKNSYSLPPKLTNERGEITIAKKEAEEAVRSAMSESPMDYSCSLNECGKIRVLIDGPRQLARRVSKLTPIYPEEAAALERMIQESENLSVHGTDLELAVANNLLVPIELEADTKNQYRSRKQK